MEEVLKSAALGGMAAAAIALVVSLSAGKLLAKRYRSFAAAAAFAVAYGAAILWLRPGLHLLLPTRHFHWPFYVALAAAVLGPLAALADPQKGIRWRVHLTAASLAALVLVPTYSALQPPRWVQVPLLAMYLCALAVGLDWLASRASACLVTGLLALAALIVAGLTAAHAAISHGISAAIAAAALAGCFVAACVSPNRAATQGLVLCYALVIGGWAYIGAREPTAKLWGAMTAALAPLAVCGLEAGPGTRLTGKWKALAHCAAAGTVLGAAVLWAEWSRQ